MRFRLVSTNASICKNLYSTKTKTWLLFGVNRAEDQHTVSNMLFRHWYMHHLTLKDLLRNHTGATCTPTHHVNL